MIKRVAVKVLLLLYGICYIKADRQELLPSNRIYLPASPKKINNNYLPPVKAERTKVVKDNFKYQHNQPQVIDDPLPMKVDHMKPVEIDCDRDHSRPTIIRGALITALYFNVLDTKKKLLFEPTPQSVNGVKAFNHTGDRVKTTHEEINGESSIESKKYIKKPDILPINFISDDATKPELFNQDDDIDLSGSAPEVIYKPGDDITFSTDTTAIDDYVHTFSNENTNETQHSDARENSKKNRSKATEQPAVTGKLGLHQKDKTAAASTVHAATAGDPYSSEATQQSIVRAKSESIDAGHGYFYDKPDIPFTF